MVLIRAGDSAAFSAFYERHTRISYGVAMRVLHNPALAAEVTQDGFLTVWRQRAQYSADKGSAKSWLLAIVHNQAVDALRRESRHQRHRTQANQAVDPRPHRSTEEEVIARDEAREIGGLLRAIPTKQRDVIELAYLHGLSQTEIAYRLDLPLGTVKGRTRLGLEKLREAYPPESPVIVGVG